MSMASLFVAPDGDLFISFIDDREELAARIAGAPEPGPHDHDAVPPAVHLRMGRPACATRGSRWPSG
jgi:hypothetical protein